MNIIIYTFIILLLPVLFQRKVNLLKCDICPVKITWTPNVVLAFIITIFIRGLAYNTGRDWFFYYDFIKDAKEGLNNPWSEHTEWLFREFILLLGKLQLWDYTFFLIVSALIVYSLIKISSLYGKAMPYIMIIWYPILFLLSQNLLRQYVAISFVYLFVYFLLKNEKAKALLCILTAILFHTSAIFSVAFIFMAFYFSKKNIKKEAWILLIVFSTVASNLFLDLLLDIGSFFSVFFQFGNGNIYDVQSFSDSMYGTSYTWIMMLINIMCVCLSDKIKNKYLNYNFFHYTAIFSYILYPICQQELLSRILLYIQMFVPITLGVMLVHYKKVGKIMPFLILCVVFITYFVMFYYYLNAMNADYPYIIKLK